MTQYKVRQAQYVLGTDIVDLSENLQCTIIEDESHSLGLNVPIQIHIASQASYKSYRRAQKPQVFYFAPQLSLGAHLCDSHSLSLSSGSGVCKWATFLHIFYVPFTPHFTYTMNFQTEFTDQQTNILTDRNHRGYTSNRGEVHPVQRWLMGGRGGSCL